ncbi:hypothetical protein D3C76_1623490 [compost metagenome]
MLRAVGDQHLFGTGGDTLRGQDPAQRVAQRVVTTIITIAEGLFRMTAEDRQQDLAERLKREHLGTTDASGKVDDVLWQRNIRITVQPRRRGGEAIRRE